MARPVAALALSAVAVAAGAPAPLAAQEAAPDRAGRTSTAEDSSPHSDASLISETRWVQPGKPFTVGLRLTLDPGWHSYWRNPGDSGEATSITWRLPEGFSAGEIRWPAPERISFPPLVSYGYFDEVLLPIEIMPPAGLASGDTVLLAAGAHWLVCIEDCFPAEERLVLVLPVLDASPEFDPETATAFADTRARIPAREPSWRARARAAGDGYRLRVELPEDADPPDLQDVHFFATDGSVIDHAAEQRPARDGRAIVIGLARSGFAVGVPDTLRGVLVTARSAEPGAAAVPTATAGRVGRADGRALRAVEIAAPVEGEPESGPVATEAGAGPTDSYATPGLGLALLFAFLGGLLLNLMPCVFPVLSLKVLGFVEHAKEGAGAAARQGAAFAAGVLVSFWILGGLLLALRGAGESVGWGFQLQSSLFVGAMALLFFLLALAFLGVFEIGLVFTRMGVVNSGKTGSRDRGAFHPGELSSPDRRASIRTAHSFGAGVLATVVATPCTAPFMGVALGWALLRPPVETMLVFTSLGAGMAAPYLGLSVSPGLIDRLPPPGRWMETLKQVLAFPLLATVVWLAWVFGMQTGVTGLTGLLVVLLLAGLAAWVGARWGGPTATPPRRTVGRVAALGIGIMALVVLGRVARSSAPLTELSSAARAGAKAGAETTPAGTAKAGTWRAWSAEAAGDVRTSGAPLFIDFTAAWCLSCQVNERVVLNTAAIRDAFGVHEVILMKADWTRRDSAITAALADLGRSSVPVYALYPRGGGDPELLPSVLTKEIVLDALEAYAPPRETLD